jgi:CRISPR-associated protein Csm2
MPETTIVTQIIQSDPTGVQLATQANIKGEQWVKGGLTRAQIRNVFAEARTIEAAWRSARLGKGGGDAAATAETAAFRRFVLLKPKLAYLSKRNPPTKPLADALSEGIDAVIAAGDDAPLRAQRFTRWMQFFEAILAYHRAHGGA